MTDVDTEREKFEQLGDQLSEVVFAMDDVDLNLLVDDDVRTFLDAKATVEELCQRARQNQHGTVATSKGGHDGPE